VFPPPTATPRHSAALPTIWGALADEQWPWVWVQSGLALGAPDGERAKQRLEVLGTRLEARGCEQAARALREGLEELVAVNRLGLSPEVRRLLRTTNPLESAFSQCGRQAQRVRRWQNGAQVVRWVAFGLWRVQGAFRPLLAAA